MDLNVLEISAICSSESSAVQFAKDHGLLMSDQAIQRSQNQNIGK